MIATLDIDQLRTFAAIVDTGSYTRAAEDVHKTQSAVSMQMRRLEDRMGKPLFEKDGRFNRLTGDGERLLGYARRMIRLNNETMAAFDDRHLEGELRIGTPDDYAERFLPEIISRFSKTNPRVDLTIACEMTTSLVAELQRGTLDLAIITHQCSAATSTLVRREPLFWVTSANHRIEEEDVLPLAFGRPSCVWRQAAMEALVRMKRQHRIQISSWSATVISAAVLSGFAVSVLPECALRPGMRVLGEAEGFPALPPCEIGLARKQGHQSAVMEAMARHISESLDNISAPGDASTLAALQTARTAQTQQNGARW